MATRAELARQRVEEEKQRLDAIARRQEEEAADVVVVTGGGASQNGTPPVSVAAEEPATPPISAVSEPIAPFANGPSADRPIISALPKPKVDRQGIDLRPEDRERVIRFEMFCLQNRLKTGRKRGLTLYARAGFRLLEELIATDKAKAEALLRAVSESGGGSK